METYSASLKRLFSQPEFLLVICGFLAHGLLLLNDGVYWDGWKLYIAHIADRWELVDWIFTERGGIPIYTGLLWVLDQSPWFIFTYKLVSFFALIASPVFIFLIGRDFGLSRNQAFFVALISMVFHANQSVVELIITPYLFSYVCFWFAWFAVTRMIPAKDSEHWVWRFIALVFILGGFRLYSMLVFHFGILGFCLLAKSNGNLSNRFRQWIKFALRFPELFFLPFVFWFVDKNFFPSGFVMAEVNNIRFTGQTIPRILEFIRVSFLEQLWSAWVLLLIAPIAGLAVLIFAIFSSKRLSTVLSTTKKNEVPNPLIFLSGCVLLFFAAAPYVINGRGVALTNFGTRHAILIGVPVGLVIVGLVFALAERLRSVRFWLGNHVAPFILFFLIGMFWVSTINFYINWQARWVRDRALIEEMVQLGKSIDDIEVLFVFDEYRIPPEMHYRFYEYYGMFYVADPKNPRLGVDTYFLGYANIKSQDENYPGFLEMNYKGVDLLGCQAKLFVEKAHNYSMPELIGRYYLYKFSHPDNLRPYLLSLLETSTLRTIWAEGLQCESFP